MKLKKLLAAVTAAALAVTTMAVTSFTVSAVISNGNGATLEPSWGSNDQYMVKYANDLSAAQWKECYGISFSVSFADGIGDGSFGGKLSHTAISDFSLEFSNSDATINGDSAVITHKNSSPLDADGANYNTYSYFMFESWWGNNMTVDNYTYLDKDGNDLKQTFVPPAPATKFTKTAAGEYTFTSIDDPDPSDNAYGSGDICPETEVVSFSDLLPSGATAADIRKITITSSVGSWQSANGKIGVNAFDSTGASDWSDVEWQVSGSADPSTAKAALETPYGIKGESMELQTHYINYGTTLKVKLELEVELGDTPAPTLTLTPNTLTVAKDDTADITITAANADGYTFTAASSDDTKATATVNGTTVTVEGKAAGTATITVTGTKSGADDITATCAVTVTDSATPPDPGHTHTPADTWTSDATGHWHACSGCTDKVDFAAHTFDSGEITTPPTETTTGVKTYKCTVCEYTKTETIPATGTNPPSHTHTAVSGWSSDSANHWHVCSECGEKFDSAAHTSDSGTVTVPATETTTGIRTYKCTVCGYVMRTETIPATGTNPDPSVPSGNQGYTGGVVIPFINNSGVARNTPVISDDNSKSGWDAIASEITASGSGSTISVDMNGATKVPSSIFREIEGLDIDLVLNMGRGIKWTVNGLSVTSHKNIDFGVSKNTKHIPNDVVSTVDGTYKRQISLDHNGTFGCTASMTIDIGTRYDGLYANLFYYNPKTEALEFADCSLVSGGNAKFVFTHASDYVITVTAEPLGEFEDVSSAAGISSESSSVNSVAPVAVLAAIVLGFGIVVYRKRRHN